MRKLMAAVLLALAFAASLTAQIAIPYSFTAGTVIDPDQMNANFTAVSQACNRTGCSMTGVLRAIAGTAGLPGIANVTDGTTGITIGTTGAIGFSLAGTQRLLLDASGLTIYGVNLVDNSGRIPNLSTTYVVDPSISASNITSGIVPPAQLGTGTANASTWLHGDSTWANTFVTYSESFAFLTPAASVTIDLSLGTHFVLSNSTTITTLTIINAAPAARVGSFTMAITGNGTAHPITWPASIKWPSGTAPTLTATNGKADFITFLTYNNGVDWFGFVAGQNF